MKKAIVDAELIRKFTTKYKEDINLNKCWIWTGGTKENGSGAPYGKFWISSKVGILAHRFSYMVVNGLIDSKTVVCHKCDTPLCVNPYHLFASDQKGNMMDMVKKGRSTRKLTEIQADMIRNHSHLTRASLAKEYKVSVSTIGRIINNKIY